MITERMPQDMHRPWCDGARPTRRQIEIRPFEGDHFTTL
jgi:hypothetical protein